MSDDGGVAAFYNARFGHLVAQLYAVTGDIPGDVRASRRRIIGDEDQLRPGLPGLLHARGVPTGRVALWWRQVEPGPRYQGCTSDR